MSLQVNKPKPKIDMPHLGGSENSGSSWSPSNIQNLLNSAKGLIQEVVKVKGSMQSAQPPIIQSAPQQHPQIQIQEKEVRVPMELDKEKVKIFLIDLLTKQALKLPPEIQEKQIKDCIGDNYAKFNIDYSVMGKSFNLKSDEVINIVVNNMVEALKNCQK